MAWTKEQLITMETKVCNEFWTWRLQNFPEFATSVGEHQNDHKLTDMSLEAFQGRHNQSKHMLQEVEELLRTFHENHYMSDNLEILRFELRTFVDGFHFNSFLCPISNLEGPQLTFSSLLSSMPKNAPTHFTNILSRLRLLPTQLDDMIDLMREGIKRNIKLHKNSVHSVTSQFEKLMTSTIDESPLLSVLGDRPASMTAEEWEFVVDQYHSILIHNVYPSLKKTLDFLHIEYLANTRDVISVESLLNGKLYYKACLQYHTSTDLTPKQVHDIGLREVERIKTKTQQMLREDGPEASCVDLIKNSREEDMESYSLEDDVVEMYSLMYDEILEKLPEMFSTLPLTKCQFRTIECTNYPAGLYQHGAFVINTHNVKRTTPKAYALALHEMIPGHHLQCQLIVQNNNIPHFRKHRESGNYSSIPARFPLYTAFGEGWALYAEHLGEELGIYKTRYQLSRRLFNELFRAARLVVDTGIHAFDWSKEQAVQYLIDVTGMPPGFASSEVDRYTTWPGQACSYKMGELKIKQFRSKVNAALGDGFDLKEFHDLVLRKGAVPLQVIERDIDSYMRYKLEKVNHVE